MSGSVELVEPPREGAAAARAIQFRAKWARLVSCCLVAAVYASGASAVRADESGETGKLVTGRVGAGALLDSRYSGGAKNQIFPVPLASLEIGDFAYVDYWEAGLFVLSNQAKTLGLAVVATPRLGFSSSDGQRLAGMATRHPSIEAGLSINYGSDDAGLSFGYLHDVTGASHGGLIRLLAFKHYDISMRFGMDVYAGVERLGAKVADYYYGVPDYEATAVRPAYQPGQSTAVSAGLHFNYDFGRRSSLLFGYEPTLLGGTTADSPIVEHRMTGVFFIGYGWRL